MLADTNTRLLIYFLKIVSENSIYHLAHISEKIITKIWE